MGDAGGDESCVEMLGGGEYLTPRKKIDKFAPVVLQPASYYINLRVIQKSTHLHFTQTHQYENTSYVGKMVCVVVRGYREKIKDGSSTDYMTDAISEVVGSMRSYFVVQEIHHPQVQYIPANGQPWVNVRAASQYHWSVKIYSF